MKNTNYSVLDSLIFVPKNIFQIKNTKSGVNSLKLKNKPKQNILICIQIKKDLQVVLDEYSRILDQWKDKKNHLENYYSNCYFLLVLLTQSKQVESGKIKTDFKHTESDVCILFADKLNSKYFFNE